MTDRELLKLAAKAAGYTLDWHGAGHGSIHQALQILRVGGTRSLTMAMRCD